MIIVSPNPWGLADSNLDAQRSDLWTLDLRTAVEMVLNPTGIDYSGSDEYKKYRASIAEDPNVHVQKITLPEKTINTLKVIQGTQHRHLPSYDEPLSATRVDFIHETTGDPNLGTEISTIYSLIMACHMLAMAGQRRFNRVPLPLQTASSKPSFKTDLTLTLHSATNFDANTRNALEDAATYWLRGCWFSDVQYPELDHGHTTIALLTATLQISAIIPIATPL